jgi:hypothetical protein
MAVLLTGLGGFNNTSLPWPLISSRDFAETPAHYLLDLFARPPTRRCPHGEKSLTDPVDFNLPK